MADYPTGVTVLTASGPRGPSGMTANAVCSLSMEPLLMLACVSRTARTLTSVRAAGRFGINILGAGQEELAQLFARKVPEEAKWQLVDWREAAGAPALEGCVTYLGCALRDLLDGGDHLIAVGAVEEILEGQGTPLLWHQGQAKGLLEG